METLRDNITRGEMDTEPRKDTKYQDMAASVTDQRRVSERLRSKEKDADQPLTEDRRQHAAHGLAGGAELGPLEVVAAAGDGAVLGGGVAGARDVSGGGEGGRRRKVVIRDSMRWVIISKFVVTVMKALKPVQQTLF